MSGHWPPDWEDQEEEFPGEADQLEPDAEARLAEVTAYLSSVPAPVMPDGIESRISAALAAEAAGRAAAGRGAVTGTAATGAAATRADSATQADALPRRTGPPRRTTPGRSGPPRHWHASDGTEAAADRVWGLRGLSRRSARWLSACSSRASGSSCRVAPSRRRPQARLPRRPRQHRPRRRAQLNRTSWSQRAAPGISRPAWPRRCGPGWPLAVVPAAARSMFRDRGRRAPLRPAASAPRWGAPRQRACAVASCA